MKSEHIAWCRQTFDMIKDGGIWGIPRSGLIFKKTGPAQLTLVDQMPWSKDMPISQAQLLMQQNSEFVDTVRYFGAAGIEVIRKDTHHAS